MFTQMNFFETIISKTPQCLLRRVTLIYIFAHTRLIKRELGSLVSASAFNMLLYTAVTVRHEESPDTQRHGAGRGRTLTAFSDNSGHSLILH